MTTHRRDAQNDGGATQSRTTRWGNRWQGTSDCCPMVSGRDFIKDERNAVEHHARKDVLPFPHKQSTNPSVIRHHKLKSKRGQEWVIAQTLWRGTKAELKLPVMTSDVCDLLKSCLRELRKTEVGLKLLKEEIKQFVDIDHSEEKFPPTWNTKTKWFAL